MRKILVESGYIPIAENGARGMGKGNANPTSQQRQRSLMESPIQGWTKAASLVTAESDMRTSLVYLTGEICDGLGP